MKKLLLSLIFILSVGGIVIDDFQPNLYAYEETSQPTKRKSKPVTKKNSLTSKKTATTSKSAESRGPEWIDGTWVYKGNVPTTWGNMYMNCALSIDRKNQTLVYVSGRDVLESGRYSVYDGAIHCGSTYWNIDEARHRIELGNGVYMYKK